ncbi:hypothetical protein Mic7113_6338 [Allocoleopsis franciscana PCC 7113]|uniref:Uncharacterized protein n=1 Tax=Allocoleopsis franciscana PCC 7113 TaxID=1173027 RepID=K9WNE0_9CYAN|nr:hypothetical protein Mic7113_6338 [Allocoleopsis franciscana PCC 7113]
MITVPGQGVIAKAIAQSKKMWPYREIRCRRLDV